MIILPKPDLDLGKPLSKAFLSRKTTREISGKKIPIQMLSNILWAANGVNRKKGPFGTPGRTAASASNSQEIDIYTALPDGFYLYDAVKHQLDLVVAEDLRALAIGQGQSTFGINVPVRFVFVADLNKLINTSGFQEPGLQDPEVQKSYYFVDTGLIAGNIYLFAASQGLASWFHNCNKPGLAKKLKLRNDQRILFGQSIGYPASKK